MILVNLLLLERVLVHVLNILCLFLYLIRFVTLFCSFSIFLSSVSIPRSALEKNQAWELVDLPKGKTIIG